MPWIDKENYLSNYNNLKRKYNKSRANLIGRERRKSFSEERNHLKSGVSNSPLPCFIKITFPLLQLSRDNRITPAEKFPYYSSKKPRECERVCAHNWRNYGCCSLNNKRAKDERKKERKENESLSFSLSFLPSSFETAFVEEKGQVGKRRFKANAILDIRFPVRSLFPAFLFTFFLCVVSLIARSGLENYLPLPRALRRGKRERKERNERGEKLVLVAEWRTFLARELFNVSSTGTGNDVEWRD